MFEIELIICIKMDWSLNSLQMSIYHKPEQQTNILYFINTWRERALILFRSIALGVDKEVYTFPKVFNLRVNVIARLEFELALSECAVQYFSQCAKGTRFSKTTSCWSEVFKTINVVLTGTTTLGVSGHWSNANDRIHHTPQISKFGA